MASSSTSHLTNRLRQFRFHWALAASGLVCGMLASFGAQATEATYTLDSGSLDSVQMVDILAPITPTPCPIGTGNCLNAPVSIDSGSIAIDIATNKLLDLSITLNGTGQLDMAGLNGYETVHFTGTTFQSTQTTDLTGSGPQYNIVPGIPGQVTVDQLDLFLAGNFGPTPDVALPTNPSKPPFSAPAAPGGSFILSETATELFLTLTGVDIGVFVDPNTGGDPVLAKADLNIVFTRPQAATPAVPEPNAAPLFFAGILMASSRMRGNWIAGAGTN